MTETQQSTSHELTNTIEEALEQAYAKLAKELNITISQVMGFINLYDEGATVPFIARYRKEQTGGLDDNQLRTLEKSLNYERDMVNRRHKILEMLASQGKLTDELQTRIDQATSKLSTS